MLIESPRNKTLKSIRRLRRCKGDEAILEGPLLVLEALDSGVALKTVALTPEFRASALGRQICERITFPPLEVEPKILKGLADADSPKGLLAVAELPRGGVEALPGDRPGCFLYLEEIQDPGNLGALARVAEATGVVGLALSPATAHPNHPRALRASAGSLLRLPVACEVSLGDLKKHLAGQSPHWYSLATRGGCDLYETDLTKTSVLLLGSEGHGLSEEASELSDTALTIPLESPVESLNVTVAAAVTLFEMRRRR